MPLYTVKKGYKYRATIRLGRFQSLAGNETVAKEFTKVGFENVIVTGSGRDRVAIGIWNQANASAKIPAEVTNVQEIAPSKSVTTASPAKKAVKRRRR